MDKNQRKKNIEKYIKDLQNKGLQVEKATEGKSIEQLSHSKITYDNFMKRRKRVMEMPKIIAENRKYDKKVTSKIKKKGKEFVETVTRIRENIQKQKIIKANRKLITDESKSIIKFNTPFNENDVKAIKYKTKMVATDFFYRYFKELSLNASDRKDIDKLINRMGNRLDLINDIMDDEEVLVYKYPYEKELMMDKGNDGDDYEQHMRERLQLMSKRIEVKYKL